MSRYFLQKPFLVGKSFMYYVSSTTRIDFTCGLTRKFYTCQQISAIFAVVKHHNWTCLPNGHWAVPIYQPTWHSCSSFYIWQLTFYNREICCYFSTHHFVQFYLKCSCFLFVFGSFQEQTLQQVSQSFCTIFSSTELPYCGFFFPAPSPQCWQWLPPRPPL